MTESNSEGLRREHLNHLDNPGDTDLTNQEIEVLKAETFNSDEVRARIEGWRAQLRELNPNKDTDKIDKLKKRIDIYDRALFFKGK